MKTDTALIGPDSVVVLYTVSHVGLHVTVVIHPGNAEGMDFVGDDQPFEKIGLFEFRVLIVHLFDGFNHFFYSLKIFRFVWKTSFQKTHYFFTIHKKSDFIVITLETITLKYKNSINK